MLAAGLEGFFLSIGLIMAVGPQNAYVLRQGLRHRHVGAVTTTCFLSDAFLITLGVMGAGEVIEGNVWLKNWLGWGGVVFLLWFALKSARSALKPEGLSEAVLDKAAEGVAGKGLWVAVLHTLAFTFLNPWVYIDTMVLVGGVSVKFVSEAGRLVFLAGAIAGSFVWFYCLGYGAKFATPWFQKPTTWRVLDSVVTLVMLGVAASLIHNLLK